MQSHWKGHTNKAVAELFIWHSLGDKVGDIAQPKRPDNNADKPASTATAAASWVWRIASAVANVPRADPIKMGIAEVGQPLAVVRFRKLRVRTPRYRGSHPRMGSAERRRVLQLRSSSDWLFKRFSLFSGTTCSKTLVAEGIFSLSPHPAILKRISSVRSGTRAQMVVPRPGSESMENSPFTNCSLSLMLMSPSP